MRNNFFLKEIHLLSITMYHRCRSLSSIIIRQLCWCHTWVGLQQDFGLSVDLLRPEFGAVCATHQVFHVSVQLGLLRLTQLLLCELTQDARLHRLTTANMRESGDQREVVTSQRIQFTSCSCSHPYRSHLLCHRQTYHHYSMLWWIIKLTVCLGIHYLCFLLGRYLDGPAFTVVVNYD